MALIPGVNQRSDRWNFAVRLETVTGIQKKTSSGVVGEELWFSQRGIPVSSTKALPERKFTQHLIANGRKSMSTQVGATKTTASALSIKKVPQGSKLTYIKAPRRDSANFATKYFQVESIEGNLTGKTHCGVGTELPNLPRNIPVRKSGIMLHQGLTHPLYAKPLACDRRKSMPFTKAEAKKTTTAPPRPSAQARVKDTAITAPPVEVTPTRPPMQTGEKKKATAPVIFVETKNLPYKITNVGARIHPKPRSSIFHHPLNGKCEAPRRDYTKSYSAKQLEVVDPDECFKNDPAMVTEYVEDIFSYLRSLETKYPIRPDFLEDHETRPWMRDSLIDWFVGVQEHLDLYLETLHLSVAILDRYLQDSKNVGPDTLQLVGIASLLVACKYEEMCVPDLVDFLRVCNNSFSKTQILTMEKNIIRQLDYSFGRPLSVHFLRRYNRIAQVPSNHHSLGKFMLELVLVEHGMSHVRPSLQAAAACCLSMGIMNGVMELSGLWTPTLVHYTDYEYSDINNLIVSLANILMNRGSSKFRRVVKKYASSSHGKISSYANLSGPLVRMLTTAMK